MQRGQLIAQIEPQDYQLRVQQAEAAVAQARVRLGLPATGTNDNIDQEQTSVVRQARVLAEKRVPTAIAWHRSSSKALRRAPRSTPQKRVV